MSEVEAPERASSPSAPSAADRRPQAQARPPAAPPPMRRDDVVVLLVAAMKPGAERWGWSRVVARDKPLRGLRGFRFAKALGSGYEGGFGVRPSFDRNGLFVVFDGEAAADEFLERSEIVRAYADHAREMTLLKLRATSAKGSWSGFTVGVSAEAPAQGPVAALTRASIKLAKAPTFWSIAPSTQVSLERAPGCRLAVGLGEAPLLRQATFSVWDSVSAMDAYARSGAHGEAIRTAYQKDFFSETMFVRFVPLLLKGRWKGRDYG